MKKAGALVVVGAHPNLHVVDGKISINQQELQNVAGLF